MAQGEDAQRVASVVGRLFHEREADQERREARRARDHEAAEDEGQPKTGANVPRDCFRLVLRVRARDHRKKDERDRQEKLVRQECKELRRTVRGHQAVGAGAQKISGHAGELARFVRKATEQPDVGLHQHVQEELSERDRTERSEVRAHRRAESPRASGPRHGPRDRKDRRRGEGHADRRSGRSSEAPPENVRRSEHPHGAERGEGDVEPGLGHEAALAVQGSDERRVEGVDEENASADSQRIEDVRGMLEVRREWSEGEKQRREAGRERRVNEEGATLGLLFVFTRSCNRARNALNRRGGDDVVRNVRDRENRREGAVALEPDDARQDRLLNEAHQDEPDFRAGDGDSAAARSACFVPGRRRFAHERRFSHPWAHRVNPMILDIESVD